MFLSSEKRRWWVALNVCLGVYMSTLDASIVNISLPTITQSFHAPLKVVAWVVTAYLIVITGCLLIMGRLTDLFGQRKIYLIGFSTFTLGSALCGLSPTIYFLVGSRIIQGLGASALMASGPAILTTAFPDEKRGHPLKGTCQEKKIFRKQEEAFFSGERCGCENGTPFGSSEQPPPYKFLWLPILFISNASRKSPFFLTQNNCY